jgi:hypothetical protein
VPISPQAAHHFGQAFLISWGGISREPRSKENEIISLFRFFEHHFIGCFTGLHG